MKEQKINLLNLTLPELEEWIQTLGEKKFRAAQIFDWLHQKQITRLEEMTNLPKALLEKLSRVAELPELEMIRLQTDQEDGTQKFLYRFADGEYVETVRMNYGFGASLCISSQVGCRMGCTFCASTLGGLSRSLSGAEMLLQFYESEPPLGPHN